MRRPQSLWSARQRGGAYAQSVYRQGMVPTKHFELRDNAMTEQSPTSQKPTPAKRSALRNPFRLFREMSLTARVHVLVFVFSLVFSASCRRPLCEVVHLS